MKRTPPTIVPLRSLGLLAMLCVGVAAWSAQAADGAAAAVGARPPDTQRASPDPSTGAAAVVRVPGGLVFRFEDVSIDEVLAKLSEAAGWTVVKDKDQTPGRIDRFTSYSPLTDDEVVTGLDGTLRPLGYLAVRYGRFLKIVSLFPRSGPTRVGWGQFPEQVPQTDELVTWIIPLYFADATMLHEALLPLVSSEATLIVERLRNSIIMTDTGRNVRRMVQSLAALDRRPPATPATGPAPDMFEGVTVEPPYELVLTTVEVTIRRFARITPVGSSLPCDFTLLNRDSHDLARYMTERGWTVDLLRVRNADGTLVPHREWPAGHDRPTRDAAGPLTVSTRTYEPYHLKPGAALRLGIDLALWFELNRPGRYRLVLAGSDPVPFERVRCRTLDSLDLDGGYESPLLVAQGIAAAGKASVRLSVVESPGIERWLLIDRIKVFDKALDELGSFAQEVVPGTKVLKAEMDMLGQVWVLARGDGANSLHVWRLHDLGWSVLVPATVKQIDLGTSLAREPLSDRRVVIAGVEGEEKFTTQSVWSMPRAQPAPAPTTTAPAKPAP